MIKSIYISLILSITVFQLDKAMERSESYQEKNTVVTEISTDIPRVTAIKFSPSGHKFIVIGNSNVAEIWDFESKTKICDLDCEQNHKKIITCAAFHPSKDLVFTGSLDGTIKIWNCATGGLLHTNNSIMQPINRIEIAPEGNILKILVATDNCAYMIILGYGYIGLNPQNSRLKARILWQQGSERSGNRIDYTSFCKRNGVTYIFVASSRKLIIYTINRNLGFQLGSQVTLPFKEMPIAEKFEVEAILADDAVSLIMLKNIETGLKSFEALATLIESGIVDYINKKYLRLDDAKLVECGPDHDDYLICEEQKAFATANYATEDRIIIVTEDKKLSIYDRNSGVWEKALEHQLDDDFKLSIDRMNPNLFIMFPSSNKVLLIEKAGFYKKEQAPGAVSIDRRALRGRPSKRRRDTESNMGLREEVDNPVDQREEPETNEQSDPDNSAHNMNSSARASRKRARVEITEAEESESNEQSDHENINGESNPRNLEGAENSIEQRDEESESSVQSNNVNEPVIVQLIDEVEESVESRFRKSVYKLYAVSELFKIDLNIRNKTLIDVVRDHRDIKIVKFYLELVNDKINGIDHDGKTALHIATENGDLEIVQLLIKEYGADINARDNFGSTPLLISVEKQDIHMTEYLLSAKADIKIEDNNKRSPISLAASYLNANLVELFIAHMQPK